MTLQSTFYLPDTTVGLRPFIEAGLFDASCVYLVDVISRRSGALSPLLQLATAFAARAPQYGHVCVPIRDIERSVMSEDLTSEDLAHLPWPNVDEWVRSLGTSEAVLLVGDDDSDWRRPLIFDGTNLYLNRYWHYEQQVAASIRTRANLPSVILNSPAELDALLVDLSNTGAHVINTSQLEAVKRALTKRLSVIAGGPGTGKTYTIAQILTCLAQIDLKRERPLRIGLCAPTGKAAARMSESIALVFAELSPTQFRPRFVERLQGSTIQRMLGSTSDGRFRFNESNVLPYDVLIVDEGSMISLPLMNNLLKAVRPEASLVIVGDPNQLTSIEAGAVLGDIVAAASPIGASSSAVPAPLEGVVSTLSTMHRFSSDSSIASCAELIRKGDATSVLALLHDGAGGALHYIDPTDKRSIDQLIEHSAEQAKKVIEATLDGDPLQGLSLLSTSKVLCATRRGDFGSHQWSSAIEHMTARLLPTTNTRQRWYSGKPLIATKNDYANDIFNGEVGIIADHDGQQQVAMRNGEEIRWFSLSQWAEADPWWTMTIHRSQGSEFDEVVIVLPEVPMPLLTRELFYTAITRAKLQITVIANDEVIRSTVERRIGRSTGLTSLLQR